tara:strand:+ start:30454 stop:30675 length:222 start_codon:yes stop_codon:yes gene_type:complete
MKNKKRFQECSKIVQIWRYRWYLTIPFEWFYICYIKMGITNKKLIYSLLIGDAQYKMEWYYTSDEVKSRMKKW